MNNRKIHQIWSSHSGKEKRSSTLKTVIVILSALMLASISFQMPFHESKKSSTGNSSVVTFKVSAASVGAVSALSGQVQRVDPGMSLHVMVSLSYRNQNQLSSFLSDVQNQYSPLYHKYLTRSQFISKYSPTVAEYTSYLNYFRSHGFQITSTYQDHVSIGLSGPASLFENVFHTSILTHQTGREKFYAPDSSLTLNVSYGSISSVVGLSDQFKPHIAPLFVNNSSGQELLGADMQSAYQLNRIYNLTGYPTNETIATILWSGININGTRIGPYVPSDISYYFHHDLPAGQPIPRAFGYPVNGAPLPGPNASQDINLTDLESTLDLEMAGSAAPGSTVIEVYGPSPTFANLDGAFAAILNPSYNSTINTALSKVVAISNSWGSSDGIDNTWIQYEQQAAARGITVLVSSGDNGNTPGPSPSYPATVGYNSYGSLAVGGTAMNLTGGQSIDGSNTTGIQTQSVWFNSPNPGNGSQGGVSSYYSEPSWQKSSQDANQVITNSSAVTGVVSGRGTPDVAADGANMFIYVSNIWYGGTGYNELWGTSIASPLDAGVVAAMDLYAGQKEGFMNPLVYRLGQAELNGSFPNSGPFFFITNGSNSLFPAYKGYSLSVGWGSINAYNFVNDQLAMVSSKKYNATFTESGLPSGTLWYVNITGQPSLSSTGSSITASLRNGTFSYSTSTGSPSFRGSGGSFTVNGSDVSIGMHFTEYYAVTFNEIGLPSGTTWFVNLTGMQPLSSTGSSISTHLANGSYSYTAGTSVPSYSGPSGSIAVRGTPLAVTVRFNASYTVTFSESGLPAGTDWFINVTGSASSSTVSSSMVMQMQNGSYTYHVNSADRRYRPSSYSGTFTVSGSPLSITTDFFSMNYTVTFTESGLSPGTLWFVNLTGFNSLSSTTGTVSASLQNGSYSYAASSANQSMGSGGGTFTVAGASFTIDVKFTSIIYAVTFTEQNLPPGTPWYVNITGGRSLESASQAVSISLRNGTYSYSPSTTDKVMHSLSGSFTVAGFARNITVAFNPVVYPVSFKESGLPAGTIWSVNLSGGHYRSTQSGKITFNLTNGTYSYGISTNDPVYRPSSFSGQSTVNGSSVSIAVSFIKVTYTLTFTESGLPSGTDWYVNITGMASSGPVAGPSFSEAISNGTYNYSLGTVDKEYRGTGGSFTVSGKSATVAAVFIAVTYAVTFIESGLPAGTSWTITVNGVTHSSVASSVTFSESNGSYSYTVGSVKGYTSSPGSGSFKISGSGTNLTVSFTPRPPSTYGVNFTESNLPAGTTWYVNVSGMQSVSSTGNLITLYLQNGSYSYSVSSSDRRYAPASYGGSISVSGLPESVGITFREVTYTVTFTESGLPAGTSWTVVLNGISRASTTSTIDFTEMNGTYSFSVSYLTGYTASPASGSITVSGLASSQGITFTARIPASYNVTFTESGLPSGTTWYVNITGLSPVFSTGTSITVSLQNGSYSYTLSAADKDYVPAVYSGNFSVSGSSISVGIAFTALKYTVTFTESGLSQGTAWYISVGGITHYSTGSAITFSEINGTYSFTVTPVSGYNASPSSGSFSISGSAFSVNIAFSKIPAGQPYYNVTFTESGLPAGDVWYVNVSGYSGSGPLSGTTYTVSLGNGSYIYSIGTSDRQYSTPGGTITVSGSALAVNVIFSPVKYTVTFTETGLPAGTVWSVTFGGLQHTSSSGTIVFSAMNGSYTYSIGTVNGLHANPSGGSITVDGAAQSVSIAFSVPAEQYFSVTFAESGLAPGTSWTVTFNGTAYHSVNSTIIIRVFNGSYSFNVSHVNGYSVSPASGTADVSGSNIREAIAFKPLKSGSYTVSFVESGLPSGTSWSVTLSGISESSDNNTIAFTMVNGTYTFIIGNEQNYTVSPETGNIEVNGAGAFEAVSFSHSGSTQNNSSGIPGLNQGYVILIMVLIAVAAISILAARRGGKK